MTRISSLIPPGPRRRVWANARRASRLPCPPSTPNGSPRSRVPFRDPQWMNSSAEVLKNLSHQTTIRHLYVSYVSSNVCSHRMSNWCPTRLPQSAHHNLQTIFRSLPYGVQYEVARYVSLGKVQYKTLLFPNLTRLGQLGTNALAVPVTAKTILSNDFIGDEEEECGKLHVNITNILKMTFRFQESGKTPLQGNRHQK